MSGGGRWAISFFCVDRESRGQISKRRESIADFALNKDGKTARREATAWSHWHFVRGMRELQELDFVKISRCVCHRQRAESSRGRTKDRSVRPTIPATSKKWIRLEILSTRSAPGILAGDAFSLSVSLFLPTVSEGIYRILPRARWNFVSEHSGSVFLHVAFSNHIWIYINVEPITPIKLIIFKLFLRRTLLHPYLRTFHEEVNTKKIHCYFF